MSGWEQRTSAHLAPGSGRLPAEAEHTSSSSYHTSSSSSYHTGMVPSSEQFTYQTGNPYAGKTSYVGPGPLTATRFPRPPRQEGERGRGRGFRGRGRGAMAGPRVPKPVVIKPKPPPPLTSAEKGRIENHNMKQLVAPKPPFRILNEMVGGGVKFEYTENPPLPPGVAEEVPLHTLLTEVEGDTSTGTGPTHEIAKNICAEHAIMGVVSRRYATLGQGGKTRDERLLEDETPFELASIAIFKMLNEWEASGFELPPALSDVLYSQQMFLPVKQRLEWIRGSNLGFTAPIVGGVNTAGRKRPMTMPAAGVLEQKNPVSLLNEIRGTPPDYVLLGTWGAGPKAVFTMGANIDGVPYSGTGANKKEAKKACAKDILAKLYSIKT